VLTASAKKTRRAHGRRRHATVAAPRRRPLVRHALVGSAAALLVYVFWLTRLEWDVEMRTWRAFGDAAIVLLFVTLALGPAARLSRTFGRALPWRRETGIWSAVTALVHTILILDGWVRWDWGRLLGYELVPQLGRVARLEPGFGLANVLGLVALVWALMLAATSSDRAMRYLGGAGWKWLHYGAYVVFYLAVLHTLYFVFMHFTLSFHRVPPAPNWFRWPLLVMGVLVVGLQATAFVKTVGRRRGSDDDPVSAVADEE
jgi:methionine sulfoxide reductase heme-binding subunit